MFAFLFPSGTSIGSNIMPFRKQHCPWRYQFFGVYSCEAFVILDRKIVCLLTLAALYHIVSRLQYFSRGGAVVVSGSPNALFRNSVFVANSAILGGQGGAVAILMRCV